MSAVMADFLDLMTDTVTVEPFDARSSYGAATYGTAVSYSARVMYRSRMIRGADGELVQSTGSALIDRQTKIGAKDRVTLADGTVVVILNTDLETDESGPLYCKLDFG